MRKGIEYSLCRIGTILKESVNNLEGTLILRRILSCGKIYGLIEDPDGVLSAILDAEHLASAGIRDAVKQDIDEDPERSTKTNRVFFDKVSLGRDVDCLLITAMVKSIESPDDVGLVFEINKTNKGKDLSYMSFIVKQILGNPRAVSLLPLVKLDKQQWQEIDNQTKDPEVKKLVEEKLSQA